MNPTKRRTAALSDSVAQGEPARKRKPTPSPEFQQARLRRDIRLLDQRRAKLVSVHEDKMATIATERKKLTDDLAAVEAALTPAATGKDGVA